MLTGKPRPTLMSVLSAEVAKALRAGIPIEDVIATLLAQVERLESAAPLIGAVLDSQRNPT